MHSLTLLKPRYQQGHHVPPGSSKDSLFLLFRPRAAFKHFSMLSMCLQGALCHSCISTYTQ